MGKNKVDLPSCRFLIHIDIEVPLTIFSKYTPENPLERQANNTAMIPTNLLVVDITCFSVVELGVEPCGSCKYKNKKFHHSFIVTNVNKSKN